ncbi:hypothetical protein Sjap_025225 [Stephania japonica]|uniref:Ankyrin repeat domain-containing protein n=1 Tax=Stephania japonica TaxID=461633 RepID=A0AAP0E1B2_9MAGN
MAKTTNPTSINSAIRTEDYAHSPVHYAVALGDHLTLSRLVNSLPKLADSNQVRTESDSLAQERIADKISAALDRRDVPHRETPLHLAVRLNDLLAARTLAGAGADVSLQNAAGWNPLQDSVCRRCSEISIALLRLHHRSAWSKWRRRLPRLVAVLRRMRDFYLEISFHFESSVIPFVGKIAPSDTYKIWKRGGNLRADTSLAGFDGLKIHRANQSFMFLGDGGHSGDDGFRHHLPSDTLLVLNHEERKIFDAFENAGSAIFDSEVAAFCAQTSVYRPGMDVTKAELVARTNWRRQERTESVGEWKARVYDIQNVVFSFRTKKLAGDAAPAGEEQILPLELEEDEEEGFLVAENPTFLAGPPDRRRHSSFVREERDWIVPGGGGRKSFEFSAVASAERRRIATAAPVACKEKEYVKSLRPSVWLTEQFPLKTEELLPLLDILANKVKAVRRLRELLTTKLPPGTFPVKVAIPVVPTVRVVITFTKFVELQPLEQFFTPLSSPRHFDQCDSDGEQQHQQHKYKGRNSSSSSTSSWLRRTSSNVGGKQNQRCLEVDQVDPFDVPSDYVWTSTVDEKSRKMKKCKSIRKGK